MIIITIIIIYLLYHSLCWCLFVHQPGACHVPGASDTQDIHSDHTLSTFLRIRPDPSVLIFWVSVTLALSDTLLMFSTIPFFIVPSAPTTTGITSSATFSVFTSILDHGFPGNLKILRFFQALLAFDPVDETVIREGFDFTLREYVFRSVTVKRTIIK